MSRRLALLAAALVATAAVVALGVGLGGDEVEDGAAPPEPPATVPSTPLADYDTSTVAIARAEFCESVPPEAVERALGTAPTQETSYGDGQPAQLTGSVRDVAHEFGCAWSAGSVTARAWVFAPPVTPEEAAALVRTARRADACRPDAAAPAFGSPSLGLVCQARGAAEASFRGLFGDAWLTCSVTGGPDSAEGADALDRAGRWCVAVAQAASAD